MTLNKLPLNQLATITSVGDTRLVSMGFTVGSKVKVIRKIHSGHMIHCKVSNTEFAIRADTAKQVMLRW